MMLLIIFKLCEDLDEKCHQFVLTTFIFTDTLLLRSVYYQTNYHSDTDKLEFKWNPLYVCLCIIVRLEFV